MKITSEITLEELEESSEEIARLQDIEKAFGAIWTFMMKRGFAVPGTTETVVMQTITYLDEEVARLTKEVKNLRDPAMADYGRSSLAEEIPCAAAPDCPECSCGDDSQGDW